MTAIQPAIQVVDTPAALARAAAAVFVRVGQAAITANGRFAVALSGGSTPKALFTLLATDGAFNTALAWDRVHVFWGDERCVPPDHADSNYRMAREAMLDRLPIPASNVQRIEAEDPDPRRAAERYEQTLRAFFQPEAHQPPRFDLVLLGMGPDGHTASLFPDSTALAERERWVIANWVAKFNAYRITLTALALGNADHILFLVGGADKADTLRDVLYGAPQPCRLPAQSIQARHGELTWLVDRAAASRLPAEAGVSTALRA
ncbi:MAG: 6-phosphogluconolactonase [Gammaproteobacteria bacterium]